MNEHFQDDSDIEQSAPQPVKWRGPEWLDNHPVVACAVVAMILAAWMFLAVVL